MNILDKIEKQQIEKVLAERQIPDFSAGDTLKVNVKVVEGTRERIQAFEGVCIARKNAGVRSSFTVRKISYGEGVERLFPLYSPRISGIEVVRRGKVRRAKLYYLRDRTGKSARISEKIKKKIGIDLETKVHEITEENVAPVENENLKEDIKQKTEAPKAEAKKEEAKKEDNKELEKKEEPKKEELKKEDKK